MRVRQHIPLFISGIDPETAEVDGLDELLALDWVKRWQQRLPEDRTAFRRWSIADDYRPGAEWLLMAEMEDGMSWAVAYLDGDIADLPRWTPRP